MAVKLHDLSGVNHVIRKAVAAAATAATALTVVGRAPFKAKVNGAYFIPSATMSGAATNNRIVSVVNLGAAGAGTTALASITYTAAVNGTANVASTLTNGTDVAVASGDIIAVLADVAGTGLPLPAGDIQVELQGN